MKTLFRSLAVVVPLGLSIPRETTAQNKHPNDDDASKLLTEGVDACTLGDFKEGIRKIKEALTKREGPNLKARLRLGECLAGSGDLLEALNVHQMVIEKAPAVAAEAKDTEARKNALEREAVARDKITELHKRLAWITIRVQDATLSLQQIEVLWDDRPLPDESWGREMPMNPGRTKIVAKVGGAERWAHEYNVAPGRHEDVNIVINARPLTRPTHIPIPEDRVRDAHPPKERAAGISFLGVGMALTAFGSYYGLRAIEKRDASNDDGHCHDTTQCDEEGYALRSAAADAGDLSTALFLASGWSFVAAGMLVFIPAPGFTLRTGASARITVMPSGLGVVGQF